jgi:hypothetical protein
MRCMYYTLQTTRHIPTNTQKQAKNAQQVIEFIDNITLHTYYYIYVHTYYYVYTYILHAYISRLPIYKVPHTSYIYTSALMP